MLTMRSPSSVLPPMMKFPPFQIDEEDFNAGNLAVLAKSPRGQIVPLNITKDESGQFTSNFVPNEVGDWTISIKSNNRQIKGSPFTVRVYDGTKVKVFGIQGGENGLPVIFTVDTTQAGNGKLKIEVVKNGQEIPVRITNAQSQMHQATFNTDGPGTYIVRVFFAAMEVPGSPFVVTIVDSSNVSAHGHGLQDFLIGQKVSFEVNTSKASMIDGKVIVNITAPNDAPIKPLAENRGAGIYHVSYYPQLVGNYKVEVSYGGKAIPNSPFIAKGYGLDNVEITNYSKDVFVQKEASIEFYAPDTGSGEPEVKVNGGKLKCQVKNIGDRKYVAKFVPHHAGSCYVEIRFYGIEIAASPLKIKAYDSSFVTTTIESIKGILRSPFIFDISIQPHAGEIKIIVHSPSGKLVSAKLTKRDEFNYMAEFLPMELGSYQVEIMYDDAQIESSPFSVPISNPSGVILSIKSKSIVMGQSFNMTADTSRAGPGDFSVRVNNHNGPLPIVGTLISAGVYSVNFLPPEPGNYYLDLGFDCKALPESPIMISVHDIRNVIVEAGCGPLCKSGELREVHVSTENAGNAELLAKITPPGHKSVPISVTGNCSAGFDVTFTPIDTGPYKLDLTYGGVVVPNSPLTFMCYDANKIKILGVQDGLVGRKSSFLINLNNSGEGELEVIVMSSNGRPITNEVSAVSPGKLESSYIPQEAGMHMINISFNKDVVPGSPLQFKVTDPNKISVRGDGLESAEINVPAVFYILANEIKLTDFDVNIIGPANSRHVIPLITESGANQLKVEYTPKNIGEFQINIIYQNQPIPKSPFYVKVWDASKIRLSKINQGQVGEESTFNIEMKDAGDGTVEISIIDNCGQLIPNQVVSLAQGLLSVKFVPQSSGIHTIVVEFNNTKVIGCPMQFNVIELGKVVAKGEGLNMVQCQIPTSFVIVAPESKLKDLDVKISDPTGADVFTNMTERSGNFRIDYTPLIVGNHIIDISYCHIPIKGSPFISKAWDNTKVLLANVGIGQVGEQFNFKILVAEAGEGVCEISILDPDGHLLPNEVIAGDFDSLDVSFSPQNNGIHKGIVLFNKTNVPKSPFNFVVIDKNKVYCKGIGSGFIPVKKLTSLVVVAPLATKKDVEIKIIGPGQNEILNDVTELGNHNFKVDFTSYIAGDHHLAVKYFNQPILVGTLKAYDISRVLVGSLPLGRVSHETSFNVDVREAGEGKLELSIQNSCGQMIENVVTPLGKCQGLYQVSCTPNVVGTYSVNAQFNGEHVNGSPFQMLVCDPKQAKVTGEGIHHVRCNRLTSFEIAGPGALIHDLHVNIKSPCKKDVKTKIKEISSGKFLVEYTPLDPGEHHITVKYFDESVENSPFIATAWNPNLIKVENLGCAIINIPCQFNINACESGPGNLEVMVMDQTDLVYNTVRQLATPGLVQVSFIPTTNRPHSIHCKFNGEPIAGSPFPCYIVNGGLASASGTGLGRVKAGVPTFFKVLTNAVGSQADLEVLICSEFGTYLPANITGNHPSGFNVEYFPMETGKHTITVKYANIDIRDSPFYPVVFDPNRVLIDQIPMGCVGKPVSFNVDTSGAGPGKLTALVQGNKTKPLVNISIDQNIKNSISFVPTEGCVHKIAVKFNDCEVPGSPFLCNVLDNKLMKVKWECGCHHPVGKPAILHLDTTSLPEMSLFCKVLNKLGLEIPSFCHKNGSKHVVSFIPQEVSSYNINMNYGGESVPGCPYFCHTYDPNKVKIVEITPGATVGQDINVLVDTDLAGEAPLEAHVSCLGHHIPVRHDMHMGKHKFTFVPQSLADHIIELQFNNEQVPGMPLLYQILNPAENLNLVHGSTYAGSVPMGQLVTGIVTAPQGVSISPNDVAAVVKAPNCAELIHPTITPISNGNIKIEYSCLTCGPHALMVQYAGQPIPGSPLVTEIFDPSKIKLEGQQKGEVLMPMFFNIDRHEAGPGEIAVLVSDSRGKHIPHESQPTDFGERISYMPVDPGFHNIHVTHSGITVPGCPIRQEILPKREIVLKGDGLTKGCLGEKNCFQVDPNETLGELLVQVKGPNTVANVNVEPNLDGKFEVTYVPFEVGPHNIMMSFNGKPISESFTPIISDASKVEVIDDITMWTSEDHFIMPINELKSLMLRTTNAGPGKITASIESPDLSNPIDPDIVPYPDGYFIKFIPRKLGNYLIRVFFNGNKIMKFPIVAKCVPDYNEIEPFQKYNNFMTSRIAGTDSYTDDNKYNVKKEEIELLRSAPPNEKSLKTPDPCPVVFNLNNGQSMLDHNQQVVDTSSTQFYSDPNYIQQSINLQASSSDHICTCANCGGLIASENGFSQGYGNSIPIFIIEDNTQIEEPKPIKIEQHSYPYEVNACPLPGRQNQCREKATPVQTNQNNTNVCVCPNPTPAPTFIIPPAPPVINYLNPPQLPPQNIDNSSKNFLLTSQVAPQTDIKTSSVQIEPQPQKEKPEYEKEVEVFQFLQPIYQPDLMQPQFILQPVSQQQNQPIFILPPQLPPPLPITKPISTNESSQTDPEDKEIEVVHLLQEVPVFIQQEPQIQPSFSLIECPQQDPKEPEIVTSPPQIVQPNIYVVMPQQQSPPLPVVISEIPKEPPITQLSQPQVQPETNQPQIIVIETPQQHIQTQLSSQQPTPILFVNSTSTPQPQQSNSPSQVIVIGSEHREQQQNNTPPQFIVYGPDHSVQQPNKAPPQIIIVESDHHEQQQNNSSPQFVLVNEAKSQPPKAPDVLLIAPEQLPPPPSISLILPPEKKIPPRYKCVPEHEVDPNKYIFVPIDRHPQHQDNMNNISSISTSNSINEVIPPGFVLVPETYRENKTNYVYFPQEKPNPEPILLIIPPEQKQVEPPIQPSNVQQDYRNYFTTEVITPDCPNVSLPQHHDCLDAKSVVELAKIIADLKMERPQPIIIPPPPRPELPPVLERNNPVTLSFEVDKPQYFAIPQIEKPVNETSVSVSGPGISTARCQETSCFVIDARNAGPGIPIVKMTGLKQEIIVNVEPVDNNLFGCSYLPTVPGAYLLNIYWNGIQIPNSPLKVTVLPCCNPSMVIAHTESLDQIKLGQETKVVIDCSRAGFGKLTASCEGPSKYVPIEIDDKNNGLFDVVIKPIEFGSYNLMIMFDGDAIQGSPFAFRVTATPDASKVKVYGEGIKHGILATFNSSFIVDTRGAGPGQLNVKIRGKKGTFQVEMKRDPRHERVIACTFNPTEVGEYYLNILWSGLHVPGSPFRVIIVDTMEELRSLIANGLTGAFQGNNAYSSTPINNYDLAMDDF